MNNTEIKLYRHKIYKDIYLIRNWNLCGGSQDSDWFEATKSLKEAIDNLWRYDSKIKEYFMEDLEKEIKRRFFEDGKSLLKAKITLKKDLEFDGYKGTLTKEEVFTVNDFEPFILTEIGE